MVKPLGRPDRPLPQGGATYTWRWRSARLDKWFWCRVYHRGQRSPRGDTARVYGPLARFDPHTPPTGTPGPDPDGRTVIYVGADLATSACEVFGDIGEARLCPSWRVAKLAPTRALTFFDLCAPGAALAIGALPALADGDLPRALTQEWARAIYDDNPTGRHVYGIRYRSAYNGGHALAVWDSAGAVQTVKDARDNQADIALRHPAMLDRLMIDLAPRQITVSLINANECIHCQRDKTTATPP